LNVKLGAYMLGNNTSFFFHLIVNLIILCLFLTQTIKSSHNLDPTSTKMYCLIFFLFFLSFPNFRQKNFQHNGLHKFAIYAVVVPSVLVSCIMNDLLYSNTVVKAVWKLLINSSTIEYIVYINISMITLFMYRMLR